MSLLDLEEVPRRTMTLFFLVDKSGSMQGNKIASVNDAIRNIIPVLRDISDNNPDAEIKIATLEFASDCQWMYGEPQSLNEFRWLDIRADGWTAMGEACLELNAKLSRKGFMKSASGSYAPVVILLSDGAPTDDFDKGIAALRENPWFKNSIRIAIAIGNDANYDVLKEFTGNPEAIYEAYNTDALKHIIRIAAVTSSQIGSQSTSIGTTNKQEQVIQEINQQLEDIETSDAEDW
ncbi:MAG: VWA domain-containing protein [Paludibacteraceae bacterium]|nr:VWA domain-containing protein [Paludibacteraceae bacterium]